MYEIKNMTPESDTTHTNNASSSSLTLAWVGKHLVGLVAIGLAIVAIVIGVVAITCNGSSSSGDVAERLAAQEARIAALIDPVLSKETANATIEGTINVQFNAVSFSDPSTPSGTVQDTNWNNVVQSAALTCRLLEFYKGGMRYGIVEIDAKNFTLATASAIDNYAFVSLNPCSATRQGTTKFDLQSLPDDASDYFVFNGIPNPLTNPDNGNLPAIETNGNGLIVATGYSHGLTCAGLPACNTIPAGLTFSIVNPIRYLREISIAPTSTPTANA